MSIVSARATTGRSCRRRWLAVAVIDFRTPSVSAGEAVQVQLPAASAVAVQTVVVPPLSTVTVVPA